jgi:hypothetical protein
MKFLLRASSTNEAGANHILLVLDEKTVKSVMADRERATAFLKSLNRSYGFVALPAPVCFEAGTLDKPEDWKGWSELDHQGWTKLDDADDFADADSVRVECHMVRFYDRGDMYVTAIGKYSDERVESELSLDMLREAHAEGALI